MNNLQSVLSLIHQISLMKDNHDIITTFTEFIQELLPDIECFYSHDKATTHNEVFPITTGSTNFGFIQINKKNNTLHEEDKLTLLQLIDILAAILQKASLIKSDEYENKEMKDELQSVIYITSHDLRTPLINIQGFSHELKLVFDDITKANNNLDTKIIEKDVIDEVNMYFNFISDSIVKMDNLLKGLLKLSRLIRSIIEPENTDINTLINTIIKEHQTLIQENCLEINTSDLPSAFCDPEQIYLVFSSIIENAIRYKKENKKAIISITAKRQQNSIQYCIEDNGIGIKKEYLNEIFKLFQRVQENPKIQGDGIGLTLAKKIIEKHQGQIRVESEYGIGSKFYIILPQNKESSKI